jgi:predicted N-acetyltransferase YhbS
VTSDNAGFYYVRDVLVHPDWQRRRVGTALVERLMEVLRAEAPDGSLVGLFTGDHLHDYYARFGFRGPASGLHGMTLIIRR